MKLRVLAAAAALLYGADAYGQKATPVVGGLINPSGVAIQPETGHLFVSDSGAGRIIRIVEGKVEDVVVGFKLDVYGKGPMFNIGPLGLLFLDRNTLVVGGGDLPDGQEALRAFTVPAAGSTPVRVEQAVASYTLPPQGEVVGEGNFYALARVGDDIFVTSNGDDTKGWVAKAAVKGSKLTGFSRSIATKEAVGVDAPVGITVSPRGELVVGQMGEINVPHDSLLTFYSPKDGKKLMNLETGLYDISALAYSPKGQLLALDFAWMKTDEGGLFQLDAIQKDGQSAVKARKLLPLDKPAAMAFGAERKRTRATRSPAVW
jgi:hypothetical protein